MRLRSLLIKSIFNSIKTTKLPLARSKATLPLSRYASTLSKESQTLAKRTENQSQVKEREKSPVNAVCFLRQEKSVIEKIFIQLEIASILSPSICAAVTKALPENPLHANYFLEIITKLASRGYASAANIYNLAKNVEHIEKIYTTLNAIPQTPSNFKAVLAQPSATISTDKKRIIEGEQSKPESHQSSCFNGYSLSDNELKNETVNTRLSR